MQNRPGNRALTTCYDFKVMRSGTIQNMTAGGPQKENNDAYYSQP